MGTITSIFVSCPICFTKGSINVLETKLQDAKRGLLSISVDNLCKHEFIIYVDKNFAIRDYVVADFTLPAINFIDEPDSQTISDINNFDLTIINMNITPNILAYLLNSIVFNKKVIFIFRYFFFSKEKIFSRIY